MIEINPQGKVRASVIWLHGLGADGHDFETLIADLDLTNNGVRVILPHAAMRPVTLNGGYTMRAWYDLYGLDANAVEDVEGIRAASQQLNAWVEQERQAYDLSANQIVVAGFSQGGAVALHAGLSYNESLAGILALSTYMPDIDGLTKQRSNQHTPILLAHGVSDDVIAIDIARRTHQRLNDWGYHVEWQDYAMAHSISLPEIEDIRHWFSRVLKL